MTFLKSILSRVRDALASVLNMSLIPRVFYLVFITILINIFVYRMFLYPKLILLLFALIFSEALRLIFHDFAIRNLLKLDFVRNSKNTFDPLAILIVLGETILNSSFIFISPRPLTFWTKPLNVNLRMLSEKRSVIFTISFAKTIASLFIASISFLILKYLGVNGASLLSFVKISNIDIFSQIVIYIFMININLIVLGLIPIYPFDMGVALENLGSFEIRKFLNATRPHGSLIVLVLFIFGILPNFAYRLSISIYNFVGNLL